MRSVKLSLVWSFDWHLLHLIWDSADIILEGKQFFVVEHWQLKIIYIDSGRLIEIYN